MPRPNTVAAVLEGQPLGLVPSPWIAKNTGIKARAVLDHAQRFGIKTELTALQARNFGVLATSLGPWVTAWGLPNVQAYLDQHDPELAAFLRANVEHLYDHDRDAASAKKRRQEQHKLLSCKWLDRLTPEERDAKKRQYNAARYNNRRAKRGKPPATPPGKTRTRVQADALPLGLLPDGTVARAYRMHVETIQRMRARLNIAPAACDASGFPNRPGSFGQLVAAWGGARARTWLAGHLPTILRAFDRQAQAGHTAATTAPAPVAASGTTSRSTATGAASKRGDAARPGIGRAVTVALAKRAERDGIALEAADRRRPPAPEGGPVRAATRVETVEEWLARGGRVTRLVGAGNANVGEVVA